MLRNCSRQTESTSSQDPVAEFLRRSPCPYAQLADVVRPPAWPEPQTSPERLDSLAGELRRSLESGAADLAILELREAGLLNLARAARLIHAILDGLRERDLDCEEPLLVGIENPSWDFHFAGEALFVSFFAPFYPAEHARSSGNPDTAFLLLQPERGFRRYGISSSLPHRRALSRRVHDRFRREGKHYNVRLNTDAAKSLRYVKPIGKADQPIRWWECAQAGERTISKGSVEAR